MNQPKSGCPRFASQHRLVATLIAAATLWIGLQVSAGANSLWYWEKFNEIPFGESDEGYIDALDFKGRARLAGSFDWNGTTDISTFDEGTQFGVWLSVGEPFGFGYGCVLGEDPDYRPGKRSVVLPIYHLEEISWDEDRVVPDGKLWLKWDEKGFHFIVYGKIREYSELGTGLGIGFRQEDVGTFTNTPNVEIYFLDDSGNVGFDITQPFPIIGKVARRDATYDDPAFGGVYNYTITSMVLGGPMILEPTEDEPKWLRRRIKIPRVRP